jgi:hypothetical protein
MFFFGLKLSEGILHAIIRTYKIIAKFMDWPDRF